MKVLVTGATGYIGRATGDALKAAGHEVYALVRSQKSAEAAAAAGFHVRAGNLEDAASLKDAVHGVDAVIHCAMEFDERAGIRDAQAVDALLNEMAGSERAFLYTSGVWVYGDTNGRMLGEIAMLKPPPLVAWRPAVEEKVLAAAERKVRSMVVRPGMVFGRKGGVFAAWYASAAREKVIRVAGDGQNHWSCVHADDLADLYRRAIEEPAPGEVFIGCSGMPQTTKKLAEAVQRGTGGEAAIEYVPVAQARPVFGPMADCLAMDCKAGSTKPARFFGWGPQRANVIAVLEEGNN